MNLKATYCTEAHFETSSLESVMWWFYHPKVERGVAVTRAGIETKMSFRLNDKDGNLIDEQGKIVSAE